VLFRARRHLGLDRRHTRKEWWLLSEAASINGCSMIAVIRTGGKQYTVAADDTLTVERIAGEAGAKVEFTDVLMVGEKVGTPTIAGAKVVGSIVKQARGPHLIVFKKRRRQNSRRKNGHRQDLTVVKIEQIVA
jgi:large subunit ribosomal protein L21